MSTDLHDPGVLEALAEGDGPAASWANVRLALRAPDRVKGAPTDAWDVAMCLATGASGVEGGVLARLRGVRKDPAAAELAEATATFGLLPADPEPWIAAARAGLRGDGRDADVLLASLLADLGALDRRAVAAAAAAASDGLWFLLPRIVLCFAESQDPGGLDAVAHDIASPLAAEELRRPGLIGLALARLGVPIVGLEEADVGVALRTGASLAGGVLPALRPTQGSARRRARRWVLELLDGRRDPASALVRALATCDDGPDPYELLAAASWLSAHPTVPPLEDVLRHGGGEDAAVLTAARRSMSRDRASELETAVSRPELRSTPAVALAGALVARGALPELEERLLDRAVASRGADRRADVLGCVVMAKRPAEIVRLLADPGSRDAALVWARYASTEEVLGALLALPVPAEPRSRTLLAYALGDQGDLAALERLSALAAAFPDDPGLDGLVARARGLLGGSAD